MSDASATRPSASVSAGLAGAAWGDQVWVPARWKSAGALAGTGKVLAPEGSPAGTVVNVWLNASGRVTSAPPERGLAANYVTLAIAAALAVVALTLRIALWLIQRFLNWRRLTAWEADWSAIGPQWTGHRS